MDRHLALRTAVEALMILQKGAGERSAVYRVLADNPALGSSRATALRLLRKTVAALDEIDFVVRSRLGAHTIGQRERALARVATMVTLFEGKESLTIDELRTLRNISPPDFQARLERLVGSLLMARTERFIDALDEVSRVGLTTHQNPWWVRYCFRLFGRGEALKVLAPRMRPKYVRLNNLRIPSGSERERLVQRASPGMIQLAATPEVFVLRGDESVSALSPLFSKGAFQVQDLASYLAVKAAEPEAGETVLDLCAAPGAKTSALAQLMSNEGRIVSVDYSSSRMRTWASETSRLGVKVAHPVIEDVSRLGIKGVFDLALLDPPCSGTGVLDHNPNMKWYLNRELVDRYSRLQLGMLEEASRAIRRNGRLVYCTCSLTVEENELVISNFLRMHPEFETRPILEEFGSTGLRGMSDCRRFYPHRDRTAGYFIARIQRSS